MSCYGIMPMMMLFDSGSLPMQCMLTRSGSHFLIFLLCFRHVTYKYVNKELEIEEHGPQFDMRCKLLMWLYCFRV